MRFDAEPRRLHFADRERVGVVERHRFEEHELVTPPELVTHDLERLPGVIHDGPVEDRYQRGSRVLRIEVDLSRAECFEADLRAAEVRAPHDRKPRLRARSAAP